LPSLSNSAHKFILAGETTSVMGQENSSGFKHKNMKRRRDNLRNNYHKTRAIWAILSDSERKNTQPHSKQARKTCNGSVNSTYISRSVLTIAYLQGDSN